MYFTLIPVSQSTVHYASDVLEVSTQQVFHLFGHIRLTEFSCCIDEHGRVDVIGC